jgi:hypothetical protein
MRFQTSTSSYEHIGGGNFKLKTMEKKQTAVEWLEWQINLGLSERGLISAIKEAKQMEKEQMKEAILDNRNITIQVTLRDAEQYYNETYGGKDE